MCDNCCEFNIEDSPHYDVGLYTKQLVESVFAASKQSITTATATDTKTKIKAQPAIKEENPSIESDASSDDDENGDDVDDNKSNGNDSNDDNDDDNDDDNNN
eukprot:20990-Heterococcus_DN1.PRE.1